MIHFSLHKELASSLSLRGRDIEILDTSASRFFLCSQWVKAWLEASGDAMLNVIRVYSHSLQVGFFILGETTQRRHGLNFKSWHLFRLGADEKDQIWIEYNNFPLLLDTQEQKDSVIEAFFDFAFSMKIDFINISVLQDTELYSRILHSQRAFIWHTKTEPSPYSRLSYAYFNNKHDKKTKTIERKIKKVESLNPILLEEKGQEMEAVLSAMHWHIKKWKGTSTPSGFENPYFINFHSILLRGGASSYQSVRPRVFSLFLSGRRVAVLYGFQHLEWFGFYCLMFDPEINNRVRPGLYMHNQLKKMLFKEGVRVYDFMAGEDEYKLLLSNEENREGAQSIQIVRRYSLLHAVALVRKTLTGTSAALRKLIGCRLTRVLTFSKGVCK